MPFQHGSEEDGLKGKNSQCRIRTAAVNGDLFFKFQFGTRSECVNEGAPFCVQVSPWGRRLTETLRWGRWERWLERFDFMSTLNIAFFFCPASTYWCKSFSSGVRFWTEMPYCPDFDWRRNHNCYFCARMLVQAKNRAIHYLYYIERYNNSTSKYTLELLVATSENQTDGKNCSPQYEMCDSLPKCINKAFFVHLAVSQLSMMT